MAKTLRHTGMAILTAIVLAGLAGLAAPVGAANPGAYQTTGSLTACTGASSSAPGALTLLPADALAVAIPFAFTAGNGNGQITIVNAGLGQENGIVGTLVCNGQSSRILMGTSGVGCSDPGNPVLNLNLWGITPDNQLASMAYQGIAPGAGESLCWSASSSANPCTALFQDFAKGNALITATGAMPATFKPSPTGSPNLYSYAQYRVCYPQHQTSRSAVATQDLIHKYYSKRPLGNPLGGTPCQTSCIPGVPDQYALRVGFNNGGGGHSTTFDIYSIADTGGNNPEDAEPCHIQDTINGANQIAANAGIPLRGNVICTSYNLSNGGSHDMCSVVAPAVNNFINSFAPWAYGMGWTDLGDHNGCQTGLGGAGTEDTDNTSPDWNNNMIAQHEISHIFGAVDEGTWSDSVMGYWGAYWDEQWYYNNDLNAIVNWFS